MAEHESSVSKDAIRILTTADINALSSKCFQSSVCHRFDSSWPSTIFPAWSVAAAASIDIGSRIMTSFMSVILRCNKFQQDVSPLYEFWIMDHDSLIGYMLPRFVTQMAWAGTAFEVNHTIRTIHLNAKARIGETISIACEREFVRLCRLNIFNVHGVKKWLETWDANGDAEHHPIRGLGVHLTGLKVPSPLRGVFGIVTVGIWVAKRSQNVTYAGKLDQLVAGGMDPRDDNRAIKALRREAVEEAGLTVDAKTGRVSRDGAYVGVLQRGSWISFFDKKDGIAGSERGQLEPGIRFTFDLEVEAGFVPEPCEPEAIAGFMLKSVNEVKRGLKCREWKPNCALVMLDFLLRKGQIRPEDDVFFRHLRPALQRRLPFNGI
ncbi:hypothetical protein E4U17_002662 [Claviceps sp. LM77 group G4]|nr:hypothetical protein E4U17_002662 [Claviceps sp. LM77 group G4]KAG6074495.1 hypothetical protein E4U33_002475 [Claviceps sp. LM78 group G4]